MVPLGTDLVFEKFGLGLNSGDRVGRSVAPVGDVDGDGILDMMIGAWGDDDGLTDAKCGQTNGLIGKAAAAGAIYIAYRTTAGGANFSHMEKISNGRGGLPNK